MRTRYYEVYYKPISPFAVIGFIILAVAFFFLTLPIFLAALAVFSGIALYFAWKIKRAVKQMEKECLERQQQCDAGMSGDEPIVIDVTDNCSFRD